MAKLDPETGEEIDSTPEEQNEALAAIRKAIEQGKLDFSDEARDL